jgi:hypothetical protein
MRASTIAVATTVALAGTRAAHAQTATSGLFVAPQVSTLGLGVEAGYRVSDLFGLRGSANFFHVRTDFNVAGVDYSGKVQLRSFGATADLFPFRGGFRLSGGLRLNYNEADISATPTTNVKIGGTAFTPAQIGGLVGRIEPNRVAPYFGIGWEGSIFSPNVYLGADLGVMLQGTPRVSLASTGATSSPQIRAALERERREVQDEVKGFRFYPVLSVSVGYRF